MPVRQATLTADKRASARVSLALPGLVRLASGEVRVTLRNVSDQGAMVEGVTGVEIGSQVAVCIRGVGWVDAKVAWAIAPRCGLAFDTDIDSQAVTAKS